MRAVLLLAAVALLAAGAHAAADCVANRCLTAGIKVEGVNVQADDCMIDAQMRIFAANGYAVSKENIFINEVTKVDGAYNDRKLLAYPPVEDGVKGFEWNVHVQFPAGTDINAIANAVNPTIKKQEEHKDFLLAGTGEDGAPCWSTGNQQITKITIEESYHATSAAGALVGSLALALAAAIAVLA